MMEGMLEKMIEGALRAVDMTPDEMRDLIRGGFDRFQRMEERQIALEQKIDALLSGKAIENEQKREVA